MKTQSIIVFLLIGVYHQSFAQTYPRQLYLPIEFQKAYEKGSRKPDGSVSTTYWQNRSEYKIKARIDPYKKLLYGDATIIYYNNSTDTLRQLTFHTYQDYYKQGSARQGFFSTESYLITGGLIIDTLMVNNESIKLNNADSLVENGTFYVLNLKKPLIPKGSIQLQIRWHYTIPGKGFRRCGAIDSTSMFIGYWYPEMAVFDDIDGWDRIVFDAETEFYHDYSDYEVEIEAPDNFMVWASVAPTNETEVYSKAVMEQLIKAKKSTEPVQVYSKSDFKTTPTGNMLKWKYTAKNLPDFSFALSDHFVWNACMYKDSLGEYFINTAYPENHQTFKHVLKAIDTSLKIFHTEFPGYSFPYKHFTIFNGLKGGGMEFPGMANNVEVSGEDMEKWTRVKMDDFQANLGLTIHEMCHMYFPFIMGIHEKKYAWMDEGMASFTSWFLHQDFESNFDQSYLGSQIVVPVMVPSYILQYSGINSYTVASYSYFSLYQLLGKDLFGKCLKTYINTWKYKHPTPYDFMFIFNEVSGKDLNWFWKRWYFDWGYMDIGIKSFKDNVLTVENLGGRPLAFSIKVNYADETSSIEEVNPAVWKDESVYNKKIESKKEIISIQVKIPTNGDAVKDNNILTIKK
jgi:hypothetical protein